MAIKTIPVRGDLPDYTFSIDLDAVIFRFQFKWNERQSFWSFDVALEDGTPVANGIPVLLGADLLGRFKAQAIPKGQLFAWDTSGQGIDVTKIGDLGDRVLLLYNEAT